MCRTYCLQTAVSAKKKEENHIIFRYKSNTTMVISSLIAVYNVVVKTVDFVPQEVNHAAKLK